MRYLSTIILAILTLSILGVATLLVIDGNLARLTGWYRFKKGEALFQVSTREQLEQVDWMRIADLHDRLECERQLDGSWWITEPFVDRMDPLAAQAILSFTQQASLVDTLPLDRSTEGSLREFGVETSPYEITLKRPVGDERTTVARYTLGATAPWFADTGDDKTVTPTTYLRTSFYGSDKRIHVVTGNILSIFDNGLNGLRDQSPLSFHADEIVSLSVSDGEKSTKVSAQRASTQAPWVIVSPIITKADTYAIDDLLQDLLKIKSLRVEDTSAVELSKQGTPVSISLTDINGHERTLRIYPAFFSEADDSKISYATVSDRNVVFTLPAAPRMIRKGSYAGIINEAFSLPLLPDPILKQLRDGKAPIYTEDLAYTLDNLRSLALCSIPEQDIARVSLNTPYALAPLRLILIPGDADSKVPAKWMFSSASDFESADEGRVKAFLQSLNKTPLERVLRDIKLTDSYYDVLHEYGLDRPDYSITLLPLPCSYRSSIFGHDMPLIKDRPPVSYIIKYQAAKTLDESATWIIHERGSNTIGQLPTSIAKYLSLDKYKWKDTRALDFPISTVKTLTMNFESAPLKLDFDYIGDRWTGTLNGEDITLRINSHRALSYLRNLNNLRVLRWLPSSHERALATLKKPVFSITLDLEMSVISQRGGFIVDNNEPDNEHLERDVNVEAYLENSANDEVITDSLFADDKKEKKTLTLIIAPININREDSNFFGQIVETGETFILSKESAWSLANNLLD